MFIKKLAHEDPALDDAIDALYAEMRQLNGDDTTYATLVDQLTKLYALKDANPKSRVSADTLALVIGNLAGIILIVGHERANVITSKALTFVSKLR